MEIRRGTPTDADVLSDLARRSKASWGYPTAWLEAWADQLRFTHSTFERCAVFVAEERGRCLGVVAVAVNPNRAEAEVEHLWVDPGAQGQGIGRALFLECTEHARATGCRRLRIESDPKAQGFYERLGATCRGEIAAPVLGEARTLPVLGIDLAG